jgi:hypothetical protein
MAVADIAAEVGAPENGHGAEPSYIPGAPAARSHTGLILLAALSVMLALGAIVLLPRLGAGAWSTTEGTVTRMEVSRVSNYASNAGAAELVRLSYSYEINGVAFVGTRVGCDGSNDLNWDQAKSVESRYVPNTIVTVYYKASDPTISCLEQRLISEQTIRTLGIVTVGLVAVGVLLKLARVLEA